MADMFVSLDFDSSRWFVLWKVSTASEGFWEGVEGRETLGVTRFIVEHTDIL